MYALMRLNREDGKKIPTFCVVNNDTQTSGTVFAETEDVIKATKYFEFTSASIACKSINDALDKDYHLHDCKLEKLRYER